MTDEPWDVLSSWLNDWLAAGAAEREALRARLVTERPDLVAEAESLAAASDERPGFLETPALLLAARDFVLEETVLPEGSMVGPYRVSALLARGGMGDVYRATDVRLHRDVALKVLAPTRTGEPRRVERFVQEARVTAALDHANVVRVYDVGLFEDRAYLVAELLEGESLRARVAGGALPTGEVVRIGVEIARGLGAAHAAGLVHRDLKPDNVFLTRSGTTKILDFGIAKLAQDDTVRDGFSTLTGVVLGTAGYLAPEQIRGKDVDARADLFALGAVLFEMLTGTRAFAREHVVDTLHAILHDGPPDTLEDIPGVPTALAGIVMRLLAKSPEARLQSSAEVIAALESVDLAAAPRGKPRKRATERGRPRRVKAGWAAVGLLGALLAAVAVAWHSRRPPGRPAADAPSVTLAVLPFRSIPTSSDGDLLELGLADVFISRLSRLPGVRVLPLTATERLRGFDPREVGLQLGATHVLTVSLQRDRGSLRAVPQLLSVADGRTLWSGTVDTDAASVFAIQDIIVTRVIEDLVPQLPAPARRRLARPGTGSNDAFEANLRGRVYLARPAHAELVRAAALFAEAVELDPEYADAWAGLASAYMRMPLFDADPGQAFAEAREAAKRALAIDPEHAEATAALGTVAFWHDWDYPRAEALLRRALELQPSWADAQVILAHLMSDLGRHDEALLEIRRARALDPAWMVSRSLEGQFLFMARRYEDSLAHLDEVVAIDPRFPPGHTMRIYPLIALRRFEDAIRECEASIDLQLTGEGAGAGRPHSFALALRGLALAQMGRRPAAEAVLARLRREASERYEPPHHEALLLHGLGRDHEALVRLRAAVETRDMYVTFLGVDPKWDALRDSPPFRELLAKAHLLEVSDRIPR